MRPFAFALMMSLTAFAAASAQPATPDSENGRYSCSCVSPEPITSPMTLDRRSRAGRRHNPRNGMRLTTLVLTRHF